MSEKISPELDYSPVVSNHSTAVFRNISPQGANSVTTSTAPVGPVELIIPPSCFRFDKSRLNFNIVIPGLASNSTVINANMLTAISRITLYDSATNGLWADISNVNNYASLVVPAATDFKQYATKSWSSTTPVTATTNAAAITAAQVVTVEDISKSNLAAGAAVNLNGASVSMSTQNPFFSRRQFYFGANSATANLNTISVDVSIPLSAFKLSVLSSEKLMYCPSNLVLQVYFNGSSNFAFTVTDAAASMTTGAAAITTANTPIISNISLTLCNEGNLAIVSQVINKVMTSGISLPIAYPTVTKQSIAASNAHSYQLSLTRGYGQRILALITAPFSKVNSTSQANQHARSDLATYNTFLNNVAIKSQSGFDATKSQDYILANREYLEDSVIQNIGEYLTGEWVHIDSFFGEKPLKDVDQHQVDGLDVGAQSSTWQIQANLTSGSSTAYDWTSIIVGQKVLTISNQGSLVQ